MNKYKKRKLHIPLRRFSLKKQAFFAKRLSFLISSGVPVLESMYFLKSQSGSKAEFTLYDKLISGISNGQSLANSMSGLGSLFGNFTVNMVRAGEFSGTLNVNLGYLAQELKKKEILRRKILSALLYPAIITLSTLGITSALVAYIFPKILPVLENLNTSLPWTTRMLIFISEAMRDYGVYVFFIALLASTLMIIAVKKFPNFRLIFHKIILRTPYLGKIILNYNLTNCSRTLSLLLEGGLVLEEAIILVADTTENLEYKNALRKTASTVANGKNISDALQKYPKIFPTMLINMVSVGEKSGNLSNTLMYLSEYYESEFEDQTKNFSSAIEPVLMIVMGVMVGFVAISIITPIYGISQHLRPN